MDAVVIGLGSRRVAASESSAVVLRVDGVSAGF
jgi:hypothetical protein